MKDDEIIKELAQRLVETCFAYFLTKNIENEEKIILTIESLKRALGALMGLTIKKKDRSEMIERFVEDIINYCEITDDFLEKSGL